MPRSRLGPLALEAQLSRSGSCSTWRAVHVEAHKQLAVKVFKLPFGGTDDARREFAHEWEVLKRLRHPGIARCYGGGFEGGDAYLAYDLIEGYTLTERVQDRARLPWENVLDVAERLTDAVRLAHDQQVIHAGLNPDKVMLTPEGDPVILNYRAQRLTSVYRSGKPPSAFELAFQPPEVLEDPRSASAKSDLYSLGAVLFYALTGKAPVEGNDAESVAAAVATAKPEKVATLVLDCPVWLSALIEQLLEKDPLARPHGAPAVLLGLKEVRRRTSQHSGVAEHVSGGFSPLRLAADKDEARQLLGKASAELDSDEEADGTSFYERPLFLAGALVALIGLVAWLMMPPSIESLRQDAEHLLATDNWTQWRTAKTEYLEPLLRRDPSGPHSDWARDRIDEIEMRAAEMELEVKARTGRPLRGEGERLYAEARQYQQFGDVATALDKYRALVTLLDDDSPRDRPYVNLARRQITTIQSQENFSSERRELVVRKIAEAKQKIADGRTVEARTILQSIIELYGENLELKPLVSEAQDMLRQLAAGTEETS